jgi:thioesterase domain-containing protein
LKAKDTIHETIEQEDQFNLWEKYNGQEIVVQMSHGNHDSMMDNRYIQDLANNINNLLKE